MVARQPPDGSLGCARRQPLPGQPSSLTWTLVTCAAHPPPAPWESVPWEPSLEKGRQKTGREAGQQGEDSEVLEDLPRGHCAGGAGNTASPWIAEHITSLIGKEQIEA